MKKLSSNLSGVLLSFLIASIAWWVISPLAPFRFAGPAVLAIFIGILLSNLIRLPTSFDAGVNFTSKKILQASIILLGFEMDFKQMILTGAQSIQVLIFTLLTALIAAYVFGRILKIDRNTNILIGVGTAICGGSAIAATAPIINANDQEISRAISTIFLFNIAAVFIFPALGHALGMSQLGFGIWAGTAINDTSSVVAAASSYGASSLQIATVVKLTRTLMIIPFSLLLTIFIARNSKETTMSDQFSFIKLFPWFILGFVTTSLLCSFLPLDVYKQFAVIGKFLIVMSIAAIGLKTNLAGLIRNGARPVLLGLGCWFAIAAISLLVQYFIGLL